MRSKHFISLNIKMLVVLIASLTSGILSYLLFTSIGDSAVEKYYMSEKAQKTRSYGFFKNFSDYVEDDSVEMNDSAAIEQWCREHKYVYISVIKDNKVIFEPDFFFDDKTGEYNAFAYGAYSTENYFFVNFLDGKAFVSFTDYTDVLWYNAVYVFSLLLSFLIAASFLVIRNRVSLKRVIRLSKEVKKIETENIESQITVSGNDEISQLSENIRHMRDSLIEKYADEKRAWDANYGLITAISHDIRTPLTALLGYLDLLSDGSENLSPQQEKYLQTCREKSVQLKDLTDKLFQYFVVFSGPKVQISPERYDAATLLSQIIGEHIAYLSTLGYNITMPSFEGNYTIFVDVNFIMRVFDNVFSNLEKYAEKTQKISVTMKNINNTLVICVSNIIKDRHENVESTKIGLETCREIMKRMSGAFGYKSADGRFTVWIEIPLKD